MKWGKIFLALSGISISILMTSTALADIVDVTVEPPLPYKFPNSGGSSAGDEKEAIDNGVRYAYVSYIASVGPNTISPNTHTWHINKGSGTLKVIYYLNVASVFGPNRRPLKWDRSCTCVFEVNNEDKSRWTKAPYGPLCGTYTWYTTSDNKLTLDPASCPKSPAPTGAGGLFGK